MLFPDNIEQKLGFDKIKLQLIALCQGDPGKALVQGMKFLTDPLKVEVSLKETQELMVPLSNGELHKLDPYHDLEPSLVPARIENSYLPLETFFNLQQILKSLSKIITFFCKDPGTYPIWAKQSTEQLIPKEFVKVLNKTIDKDGKIPDKTTPELGRIRREMIKEQLRLKKSLDGVLRKAQSQGWTDSDSSLTVREGRLVIPIQAEHKRRLKGLIHDVSATGKTVFLEPASAIEVNNNLRELRSAEQREIIKILTSLTDLVRPNIDTLTKALSFLAKIDFAMAKALLAKRMEAVQPNLSAVPMITWVKARHPLLEEAHSEQGKPVVPLDIFLSFDQQILVISGPNAGGKSVCLKTVGLLQLMLQSGLLVPANENSKVGIFKNILVEIGDEQSIEDDLSTYSSHLHNMLQFLNRSGKETLFLIDEFGSGTDPQFGGALAKAILLELHKKNSFGLVTTHYAVLKSMAQEVPGITNAAMRYNIDKLEPLYELEIGKPGSSFALEIAQKIGLPDIVIEHTKEQLGVDQISLHDLLAELTMEKAHYQALVAEMERKTQSLETEKDDLDQLKSSLKDQRQTILEQAKHEAQNLLTTANQKIETTIRIIKERSAEKEATREVRRELEAFQKSVRPKVKKAPLEDKILAGPIRVGDWVRIKGTGAEGEVTKQQKNSVEVLLGAIKSNIKLNRLVKIAKPKTKGGKPRPVSKGLDLPRKKAQFNSELDLRGARAHQALDILDRSIDQAILVSCDHLRIVHGKGDGILKELVWAHLLKDPHVMDLQEAHPDEGGAGVTLVRLK